MLLYPKFHCYTQDAVGDFTVQIPDDSEEYASKCAPHYFCKNNSTIDWHIDTKDPITLDNWMKEYNLYCESEIVIGLIGTCFFIGFALMSPIIPTLSDKYGRKWFFVGPLVVNAFTLVVILSLPGNDIKYFYVIIAMWFLAGC